MTSNSLNAKPGTNVEFFPPILRQKVLDIIPRDDGYVVVYQTSNSFTRLPELLHRLPFHFKVFSNSNFEQTTWLQCFGMLLHPYACNIACVGRTLIWLKTAGMWLYLEFS